LGLERVDIRIIAEESKMRNVVFWALLSGIVIAALLWLTPVLGRFGEPSLPAISGREGETLYGGAGTDTTRGGFPDIPVDTLGITYERDATEILRRKISEVRLEQGLPELKKDRVLDEIALRHAKDMIARDYLDHVNPQGESPSDRIARGHRTLVGVSGENIALRVSMAEIESEDLAEEILSSWLGSEEHRGNILRKDYTHAGLAICNRGENWKAVHLFGGIHAYIESHVPDEIARGASLDLDARAVPPETNEPVMYDFFSPSLGVKVAGPFAMDVKVADPLPGRYRTRFYFERPGDGSYTIYNGPEVEIE
jgi:hypothetical protein